MKRKAVIFGFGETAYRCRFYLENDSDYEICGFTADRAYLDRQSHEGLPVIAFDEVQNAFPPSEFLMHIAVSYVGVNRPRAKIYAGAKAKGYALLTYVSSRSITWPDLVVGDNTRIYEGAIIQVGAKIGSNVVIGPGSVIGHDTIVKDHCFVSSGVTTAGKVVIEPFCFIGAGAVIRDCIHIASDCVIGAGVVLLKDTREKEVYRAHAGTLFPKSSDALRRI